MGRGNENVDTVATKKWQACIVESMTWAAVKCMKLNCPLLCPMKSKGVQLWVNASMH
jgi:hypothetical protein